MSLKPAQLTGKSITENPTDYRVKKREPNNWDVVKSYYTLLLPHDGLGHGKAAQSVVKASPRVKRVVKRPRSGYDAKIVLAYFESQGLPEPNTEYAFAAPKRRWRFDFAWPDIGWRKKGTASQSLALEIDGGIWIGGGHNRGAQMLKTWEKENTAVCMGWRILRCQPKDLCTQATIDMVKKALAL